MPLRRSGGLPSLGLIILAGIVPLLIYHSVGVHHSVGGAPGFLTLGVVAAQVGAIVWLAGGRLAPRARAVTAVAAFALMVAAVLGSGLPARSVGLGLGGLCHAAAYTGLLVLFALSLRPGHEPMVTRFARRIRATMPAEVARYTRHVTIAWCVLFAAQLGISAMLLAGAPAAVWSAFVNFWSLPLVVAMFLAEFGCRLVRFRHEHRTGLFATLAGLRHARGSPGNPP
jgi:uncharacterized membrane protein